MGAIAKRKESEPAAVIGWTTIVCWILLGILQRFFRGFDPLWHLWEPEWEKQLLSSSPWRQLYINPNVIGTAASILITLLIVCYWLAFWLNSIPTKRTSVAVAFVAVLVGCTSYPFLGSDLLLYEHYARAEVVEGENPYESPSAWRSRADSSEETSFWEGQASPYGPLVQRIVSSLYTQRLGHRGNAILLRLVWTAIYALVAFFLLRSGRGVAEAERSWFLLSNPVVFLELVVEVHTELLLIPWLAMALAAARARKPAAAMFCLMGSLTVKPIGVLLLLPVIAYSLRVGGRAAGRSLIMGGLGGVGVLIWMYRPYWIGWGTLEPLFRESQFSTKSLAAIFSLRWGHNPMWYQMFGVLLTLGATARASWEARTFPLLIRGLAGVLLVYLLLVVPFFQMWYLAWFIPLFAVEPTLLRKKTLIAVGAVLTISAYWGSYGLQFVSPTQERPLELMSIACVVPTLLLTLFLWSRKRM